MVCFSLDRSHRALLRIIHAIVFDAHHAVRNGVDKERRHRDLQWPCFLFQKQGEEHHPAQRGRKKAPRHSALSILKVLRRSLSFTLESVARLLATIMATRQRLRAVLDVRRASRPCWRCALDLTRYSSTSAAGTEESSESMDALLRDRVIYDKINTIIVKLREQDIDDKSEIVKSDTQSPSVEIATRRSDGSKGHASQILHEHSFDANGLGFFRHVAYIPSAPPVRSIVTGDPPGFDSPFLSLGKTEVQSS